ncbi:hypothetical protein HZS_5751 [Henneguya salminicola]|nr:hypothetical protein HZS_5751 [Henneguya salminicola]
MIKILKNIVFCFKHFILSAKRLISCLLFKIYQKIHIQTILQFSLLEFKFGDPELGCTLI